MKSNVAVAILSLFLPALSAFAAPFSPTLMRLSAPGVIQYAFDGKNLAIPVTVSGTQANAVFCVYTNGKSATIKKVQNGYLGWHYVNNVDTSVYISTPVQLSTGTNTIYWSGKDDDGKLVPNGDYTYYIFGYDNVSNKQKVNVIMNPGGSGGKLAHIQEMGTDGKPLANPLFYGRYGLKKWVIGYDPLDSLLIETTTVTLPSGWGYGNGTALQPDDYSYYYVRACNPNTRDQAVYKMKWVPNGISDFNTGWGTDGRVFWTSASCEIGSGQPGCEIIGDFLWTGTNAYHDLTQTLADLDVIDWRVGTLEKKIDMNNWWSDVEDARLGAQLNGGPNGVNQRNGLLTLNCHCSCIKQMVDPAVMDDLDNFVIWTNQNGDYVLDKNYETTSGMKWVCNDYNTGPWTYQLSTDANLFSNAPSYDCGAVSFGLLGPDGDGIGYFAYAGDTAGWKWWNVFLDNGGAFDGIYCDDNERWTGSLAAAIPGTYFIAHDSIKGVISSTNTVPGGILAISAPPTVSAGSQFVVEVKAQDVTDLYGASFVLNWTQGAYIDYVKAEQGDFLGSDVIFYPSPDETASKVAVGISRKSGQSNVSGTGVLAKITFVSSASTPNNTVVAFTPGDITANKNDGSSVFLTAASDTTVITGVTVWPGDTNNNGKVDQSDILPLGLYWGKTGSQRPSRSTAWTGQSCTPWSPVAATYADANGDGVVNQADVLVIGLNWGKTHALSKDYASKTYAGGTISPVPQTGLPIGVGTEFYVDVNVKDASGLFGLSFVLSYDNKDFLEPVSAEAGAFLGSDVIFFPQVDGTGDKISVGISRKSGQTDAGGAGTVVRVKFRASKAIEKGMKITFTLTDVTANNSSGESVSITPQAGYLMDQVGVNDSGPAVFSLSPNYPNPFNPETSIGYSNGESGVVRLDIVNISGQLVRTLVDRYQEQGRHTVVWDGRDGSGKRVSAGVYLYRLRAGGFVQARKMVLMQ